MVLTLQRTSSDYDRWARLNVGGFANINSVPPNSLAGMGGVLDFLSQGGQALLAPAQQKLDDLDTAIKALLVMGGISALTGLVLVFKGR
jgi:1,6-anhydro-N-acetylmuramate kinase